MFLEWIHGYKTKQNKTNLESMIKREKYRDKIKRRVILHRYM